MSATMTSSSFTSSRDELNVAPRPMDEAVELKLDDDLTNVSNMESAILRIAENHETNRQMLNAFITEEERPVKRSLLAKAAELSRRSLGLRQHYQQQIPQEQQYDVEEFDDDQSIPSCINIPACLSMTKRTCSIDERWEREYTYLNDFKLKTSDEPTPDWRSIYERDGLIPATSKQRPPRHSSVKTSSNNNILTARNVFGKDRLGALACVTCVKGTKHNQQEEMTGATESSGKVEKQYSDGEKEVNENWVQPSMYSF